ncbi:MAG: tRNA pseudouridine(38-40) synthase TruA [Proteobacteria bacterium]|nr:tRNA pseudouridine(38-40) synthase TruA [Pseudomonadota bacterium]
MRTLRLTLAFDGTNYAGWQCQKNQPTIQGVLEAKLARMTATKVQVNGAGRTDAGVHALGMVASFCTDTSIPVNGFRKGLNSMLPPDIRVLEVVEEVSGFHARFSAVAKAYEYRLDICDTQLPTERLYAHHLRQPLDQESMQLCLQALVGTHDFSSFEATGSRDLGQEGGRGAVRTLFLADYRESASEIVRHGFFHFVGNGFLRHMVRNLVGTLIYVGQGKLTPAGFVNILQARDRTVAGPMAPARGLFLKSVSYDQSEVVRACGIVGIVKNTIPTR